MKNTLEGILWWLRMRYGLPLISLVVFWLVLLLIPVSNIVLQYVGSTLTLGYFATMVYFILIKKEHNAKTEASTSSVAVKEE